jgi:hypothetical protein
VLLDAVPSVVAELIVAILVVVAAKLVSANEISPNATSAREKRGKNVMSLIFLSHQLHGYAGFFTIMPFLVYSATSF